MQRNVTVGMGLWQDLGPQRLDFDADFSSDDDSVGSELMTESNVVWRGWLLSIN